MNIIEGANFSAPSKTFFNIFSDYPTNLFIIDEAERAINVHPASLARALHIYVLPFPGGPYSNIPRGGALIP